MGRMGQQLYIALLMLWKIEKVEAMSEECQEKTEHQEVTRWNKQEISQDVVHPKWVNERDTQDRDGTKKRRRQRPNVKIRNTSKTTNCVLLNESTWSTDEEYMVRCSNTYDIFF